jgi:hypothetical protein
MSQNQTAVVDAKGVYIGMYDEGAELPAGALRIPQIQECDLEPGRYYWDGKAFQPRARGAMAAMQEEPNMVTAIYDALVAIQRQGIDLPATTREWMTFYASSFDNNIRGKQV